ncbi:MULTISPECIES: DoxX family protein [Halocynthiibacter]|uniref:DoxX family protein n=1 Tax=Halocynthiibacter halioticoli TaxID=2986804 RepID=A0AAE3LQS8_9RHOB|nr:MULTISPECIES: DoxX family protein [Halocynthiibacter]MCV6823814.1 DoxX family protein [Halocynthiibacter halioticoli]MCW4056815.1 DoxX family protein [Halocynthiibacter sp. SDUM655004]
MSMIVNLYNGVFSFIERLAGDWLLPTLARFTFAATLLFYFWGSAMTKLGDGFLGFLSPSTGAYAQIFPKTFEAVNYDTSQLGVFHWLVVMAGMYAEFILPALILLGLFTRLAAVGMIGFVIVQSLTDIYGHGATQYGAWFDRASDGVIMDQRLFWITTLVILVLKGAGPISLDRLLANKTGIVR